MKLHSKVFSFPASLLCLALAVGGLSACSSTGDKISNQDSALLSGNTWTLRALPQHQIAIAAVPLSFHGNAVAGGSDGCNTFQIGYQFKGSRGLRFAKKSGDDSSSRSCGAAYDQFAAAYKQALTDTVNFRSEGQMLYFLDAKGDSVAIFEGQDVPAPAPLAAAAPEQPRMPAPPAPAATPPAPAPKALTRSSTQQPAPKASAQPPSATQAHSAAPGALAATTQHVAQPAVSEPLPLDSGWIVLAVGPEATPANTQPGREALSLYLSRFNRLSGFAGCNRFEGRIHFPPNPEQPYAIRVVSLDSSSTGCLDRDTQKAERAMLDALDHSTRYAVHRGNLYLYDARGVQQLHLIQRR